MWRKWFQRSSRAAIRNLGVRRLNHRQVIGGLAFWSPMVLTGKK